MPSIFERNTFFVKEHVGLLKAANNYDVFDPDNLETPLLEVREEKLGFITKALRFTEYKRMTPFNIFVKEPGTGKSLLHVHRGIALFLSKVVVNDEKEQPVGMFKQKLFSIGGAFNLLDPQEQPLGELKGNWKSWEFTFSHNGQALGKVSKKWAGLAKELFTTADNYVIEIDPSVPADAPQRKMMLAACFCIDMVLKE